MDTAVERWAAPESAPTKALHLASTAAVIPQPAFPQRSRTGTPAAAAAADAAGLSKASPTNAHLYPWEPALLAISPNLAAGHCFCLTVSLGFLAPPGAIAIHLPGPSVSEAQASSSGATLNLGLRSPISTPAILAYVFEARSPCPMRSTDSQSPSGLLPPLLEGAEVRNLTHLLTDWEEWKTTALSVPLSRAAFPAVQARKPRRPAVPEGGKGATVTPEMPGSLFHTSAAEGPVRTRQEPPDAINPSAPGVASSASPKACVLTIRLQAGFCISKP